MTASLSLDWQRGFTIVKVQCVLSINQILLVWEAVIAPLNEIVLIKHSEPS